jgi:ribonuclease HI
MHDCLHALFTIMWATGVTPDEWKQSTTTLLHKGKLPECDISGYRPIALLDTCYKLWTKMITAALSDYAEKHSIVSPSQKGFRKFSRTSHQLQMLVMALEDARLTGQNIYNLSVDFSSAFNMMNHDTLLCTMYDLGFPTDGLDAVKNLYEGATTRVRWDGNLTAPIPIKRGSIQGDSLSPFLFLMYIEPLLRWLQVGARGYKFGAIHDLQTRMKNHVSSAAYADDLAALTGNLSDLMIQAEKISRFADWADLPVNTDKTIATAALHNNTRTRLHGSSPIAQVKEQLESKVMMQGKPVTYLNPTAPFTYLGIKLTMTLDWRFEHQKLLETAKSKCDMLNASFATPQQKQKIVETAIKPSISYAFNVTPCIAADIKLLDSVMTNAVKRANGLPKSTPTAMVHEDVESFGLGCASLAAIYAQNNATALLEALRDEGKMGVITRAVLQQQLEYLGSSVDSPKHSKHMMRARQLAIVTNSGLEIRENCELRFTISPDIKKSLERMSADSWDENLSFSFLFPLLNLGITHLGQLIEPNGKHVIDGATLKRLAGHRCKAHHIAALNRLARLLHWDPQTPQDPKKILKGRDTNRTRSKEERRISPHRLHLSSVAENETLTQTPCPSLCADPDQTLIMAYLKRREDRAAAGDTQHEENQVAPETGREDAGDKGELEPERQRQGRDRHREHVPGAHTQRPPKKKKTTKKQARNPGTRSGVADIHHNGTQGQGGTCPCKDHDYKHKKAQSMLAHRHSPAEVMQLMWGGANRIEKIAGWRIITERSEPTGATTGRKRAHQTTGQCERITQIQYLIHWQPTHIEEWALGICEDAGYKPETTTPCTRQDLIDEECTCEVCWTPDSLEHDTERHDDMLICSGCEKAFHLACLGRDAPPNHEEDPVWHCPACTKDPNRPADNLVTVDWKPTWEPASYLVEQGFGPLLEDWTKANHDQPPARTNNSTLDAHLSNLERQGFPECSLNKWKSTQGDCIRSKIKFIPTPVNPQADIVGTGRCRIEIHSVDTWTGQEASPEEAKEMACVYYPDGRCAAMCTVQRLATLKALFEKARQAGQHDDVSPKAASFEEEVLDLFLRHQPAGGHRNSSNDPRVEDTWCTHPALRAAIATHLGASKERFSSPLEVADHTTAYWSRHGRDKLFGAQKDAYSVRWTGHSVAFPGHDSTAIDKAMRWAFWSAENSQEPTATLIVIPRNRRTKGTPSYRKWIQDHPGKCVSLTTIPYDKNTSQPLWREDRWAQRGTPSETAPAKDLELVLVSNVQAQAGLRNKDRAQATHLLQAITRAHAGDEDVPLARRSERTARNISQHANATGWLMGTPNAEETPNLEEGTAKQPVKFMRTESETPVAWPLVTPPTAHQLQTAYPPSPLRHDWRGMCYTDGSHKEATDPKTGTKHTYNGAGIFVPATQSARTVDPGGSGPTSTITRAELAGIWAALQGGSTYICTDSACSIAQIRKAVLNPGMLRHHKHADLLAAIVEQIRASPQEIMLMKVPAHNGIIGNELVDGVAKRAAAMSHLENVTPQPHQQGTQQQQQQQQAQEEHVTVPVSSQASYEAGFWLYRPERHTDPNPERLQKKQRPPGPLDSLEGDLRDHMHAAHRLGTSNTNTIYYNSWQRMRPTADGPLSNAYNKPGAGVSHAERTTTNKYRTGQLWNRRMAYLRRCAQDDACPLCRHKDGGTHIASGCNDKRMKRMYQERHNRIGRIVLRAISKGEMGGDIRGADVGRADRMEADGAPSFVHNHVPQDVLPKVTPAKLCKLKPDGLLITLHRDIKQRRVHIIEVKCCQDTSREEQLDRARKQHAELTTELSNAGYEPSHIRTVPILIGVSGTIYKDHTLAPLQQLGLSRAQAVKCAKKLHLQAIRSLHSIVKTRRMLEHLPVPRPAPP